jgi:hypothetical protein
MTTKPLAMLIMLIVSAEVPDASSDPLKELDLRIAESHVQRAMGLSGSASEMPDHVYSRRCSGGPCFQVVQQAAQPIDSSPSRLIDVKAYGAKGDGSADDTAAIQAALNAMQASRGHVYLPSGTYKVSATLTVTNKEGFRIEGAHATTTALQPTADLGGRPVVKLTNNHDGSLENFRIFGLSGSAPSAAVNFHRVASGGYSGTNMRLSNLILGSDSTNSLVNGVRYTADADSNNDLSTLENLRISNFTGAAVSIEHSNSLGHRIIGGIFQYGPTGVKTAGGSFVMMGTWLTINAGGYDFDIATGTQEYANEVIGVFSEGRSNILRAAPNANTRIAFIGYHKKGSTASATIIDFAGTGASTFTMSHSVLNLGAVTTAQFPNKASTAIFRDSVLNLVNVTWNGMLVMEGNTWLTGNPVFTPGADARFVQSDVGSNNHYDARLYTITNESGSAIGAHAINTQVTWNNKSQSYTAWRQNITDTASAPASKLLELLVGGNSKVSIDKTGKTTLASGASIDLGPNTVAGAVTDKLNAAHLAIASQAQGDLLCADTATSFNRLPADTALQTLVSSGRGACPKWSGVLQAYKMADESVSSSTTLKNDDELSVRLGANATYHFKFLLFTNNVGAAEGLRLALNGSVGVTNLKAHVEIWDDTTNALAARARVANFESGIGARLGSGSGHAVVEGTIETSRAGTFLLQWAQYASGNNATRLERGSSLVLTRVK